jgi:hypothetical protein
MNFLRPFISRVIAPFIAAIIGFLASKGLDLGEDATERLTEFSTWLVFALLLAANGVIHRLIDKKVNKGDAAVPELAVVENAEADRLKV